MALIGKQPAQTQAALEPHPSTMKVWRRICRLVSSESIREMSLFSAWNTAQIQPLGFYLLKHWGSVAFTSALRQRTPERFGFISGLRCIDLWATPASEMSTFPQPAALATRSSDQRALLCRSAAPPWWFIQPRVCVCVCYLFLQLRVPLFLLLCIKTNLGKKKKKKVMAKILKKTLVLSSRKVVWML